MTHFSGSSPRLAAVLREGGGTFAVPVDTKVWDFNTVLIWSKAHHAVVGKAPLHGNRVMGAALSAEPMDNGGPEMKGPELAKIML